MPKVPSGKGWAESSIAGGLEQGVAHREVRRERETARSLPDGRGPLDRLLDRGR
jgi:hypothetical protein